MFGASRLLIHPEHNDGKALLSASFRSLQHAQGPALSPRRGFPGSPRPSSPWRSHGAKRGALLQRKEQASGAVSRMHAALALMPRGGVIYCLFPPPAQLRPWGGTDAAGTPSRPGIGSKGSQRGTSPVKIAWEPVVQSRFGAIQEEGCFGATRRGDGGE